MRLPAALACGLLLLPGVACAVNKPNPVCLNREEFIEYGRRTSSPAVFKLLFDPGEASSFTRQFSPMFEITDAAEKAALAGDLEARYALGETWGECMLDGFEYDAEKRVRAIEYVKASSDAGRKKGKRLLGFIEALGWASAPGSALRAYPLLLEGGVVRAPSTDQAAVSMTDDEKSRYVFATTLRRILPETLDDGGESFVVDSRGRHSYALTVSFSGCQRNVAIEGETANIRIDLVSGFFDALSARLPRDGMDCTVPERNAFRVPITLQDATP